MMKYFSSYRFKDFRILDLNCSIKKESGTEIGNSLEFDFAVPPPHS